MPTDVLERFSPATRAWFTGSFGTPTPAQVGAWDPITAGDHTMVVAPTGSGKTLSAFLWALDRLAAAPAPQDPMRRCRVVYVSPMKALAVDVERNLRAPLTGIRHAATEMGQAPPDLDVAVRSGDTPPGERRRFAKRPSDVLITTPESLFLLLTSAAREALAGVETVILDEVHAVAGTKRGAHLAVSLERLDALLERPAQRIGLSATVRPPQEVARFLAGGRPVTTVEPPSDKQWQIDVVVPVRDLTELGRTPAGDADTTPRERSSIWPHVEERIVDLVSAHRSTLVFANSRRLAERLTTRLNEIWQERCGEEPRPVAAAGPPAELMGGAGQSWGAPAVLARAHHGSVSKEARAQIEDELKTGRLPAVVATSSLELGIDMGAVDLVIQVESPPSVASGLQRVGRAGHHVGAVSRGVVFPKFRSDLVQASVVVQSMLAGRIEALQVPRNPLDVLAQQIVAMCAMDEWSVEALHTLVRRAAPFGTLPRTVLDSVLDMLSGRYPSDEFAELRPRVVWDRIGSTLSGRKGAQWLATTSGGTIPDRGLFTVLLASADGPGRRVGELDEEMVYESRVGDVITLDTTSWRVEEITRDQVLVTPAPGEPGRLPFWRGDAPGRPAELGREVGGFVREMTELSPADAEQRAKAAGLDQWGSDNLIDYLREQVEATGRAPDDRTLVVERFRDELGDWRVVVHSPHGAQVHAPWALAIAARLRERFGSSLQVMHADDGIVLRLPDTDLEERDLDDAVAAAVAVPPDEVREIVTTEIGGSALFASRFRECAARALLLPRRQPGRRQALWQQRQRSAQLLEVAAAYPSFPIMLETVRECLQDVFDVPSLVTLLEDLQARRIRLVTVRTESPSPFARSLMFGYVAQFLYEGDSPLAERRAAALALDPSLLADLLGHDEGSSLRDLLDPEVIIRTERELQWLTPTRQCRRAGQVTDLLRVLGPLDRASIRERTVPEHRDELEAWITELTADRRIIEARWRDHPRYAVVEDAARLRDGLGAALPPGLPAGLLAGEDEPLTGLVRRFCRTHALVTSHDVAQGLGIDEQVAHDAVTRLVEAGQLTCGELRPLDLGGGRHGLDYGDRDVVRWLKRRSMAALRAEVEPVEPAGLARFLPAWQGLRSPSGGPEALLRAVEQLAGLVLPASAVETLVLPARVRDYSPAMLDEAMAAGEVLWQGHGALAGHDGWISLHPADVAHLTLSPPGGEDGGPLHHELLGALAGGGGHFFTTLASGIATTADSADIVSALWDLVWSGRVAGDTLAPLRALLSGGRTAHRAARRPRPRGRYAGLRGIAPRPTPVRSAVSPTVAGRWSLLPAVDPDPTHRALATAQVLLDRYGVVTRGVVGAEDVPGGFSAVYRVLAAAEDAGRVRRGYFVEGLGAAQFATAGAIDRLRAESRAPGDESGAHRHEPRVLAACDPANPFGAALPWPGPPPGESGHRPGRKAGALVVLTDGDLVLFVERGGGSILTWEQDPERLEAAARALARLVTQRRLPGLTVRTLNGIPMLQTDHPLAAALRQAGFHLTPRGLRMR